MVLVYNGPMATFYFCAEDAVQKIYRWTVQGMLFRKYYAEQRSVDMAVHESSTITVVQKCV